MSTKLPLWIGVATLGLSLIACGDKQEAVPKAQATNPWYTAAETAMNNKPFHDGKKHTPKNVILFIGDGMGISTITAARILEGQQKGLLGEENNLSFDLFPYTGISKTYNVDAQTPDSAGTMTAMMTGVKSDAGVIGVDEGVERGKCSTQKGHELVTALDLAEIAGKSTGVVTTTRITHATPAATYAKSVERNWEDDGDMPADALAGGCVDIATQLVEYEKDLKKRFPTANRIDGIDVLMGGGRRSFLPKDAEFNSPDAVSEVEGDRKDGKNLIAEWQSIYPKGQYVYDQKGFDAIDPSKAKKVLGLFNESHMHYEQDRKNDGAGEPSLTEMTSKAIDILDNNKEGFFLMVEAGRIDHAHHAGNASNALNDTIELSNAVRAAIESTNPDETLIIVTADHSHVFTIAGYPQRGNPILGKVVNVGKTKPAKDKEGLPYTTLGYANGLGFRDLKDETDADASYEEEADTGRHDLTDVNTTAPGYHQEALVPLSSETHGGEDVAIFATGPGAAAAIGMNEQNMIFHMMNQAAKLDVKAQGEL